MLCDYRDFLYQASEEDLALYLKMIPKDHRLLKALHVIDFEQLIPELIAGYSPSRGQPAIPPILAFKWELLKYWYNLSDRSVMERTETDVAFRYFLQVPISFWPPAHTLLTRFRGRLGEQGYRRVFQTMVAQARGHGLVKDQLRLKDATHILANISIPSTLALAAQVREGLIESLQGIDPEVAEGYRIATEQLRQQNADQDDATRLARRVELIGDIVQSAKEIPQDAKLTRRQREKLDEAIQLAERLLSQHQDPKQPGKLRSTADPEAGRGKHGIFYDGYVLDVAIDAHSELITAIDVLPAGGNEAESAVRLIQSEHDYQGNQVEAISIDGAGHNGEMIRRFEGQPDSEHPGMGVTVYVPPKKDRVDVEIPSREFIVSEDEASVTCPQGETSTYRSVNGPSVVYRFAKATCEGCPLRGTCAPKFGKTPFGRTVSKSTYAAEYARVKQRAETEAFARVRKRHGAIERKLRECVGHHGGRRARYWGRAKVAVQHYGIAMVVNIKRMLKLLSAEAICAEATEAAIPA